MVEIEVRLFGFGDKAAGFRTTTRPISPGDTAWDLWQSIHSEEEFASGPAESRLDKVLVLVNGAPVRGEENLRGAALSAGDRVTFMVLAMGG